MENYEISRNIDIFSKRLNDLKDAIDLVGLVKKIESDDDLITSPTFYNDLEKSQMILKRVKKQQIRGLCSVHILMRLVL